MKLSYYQKHILNILLDKYERSKQYSEESKNARGIMIRPTDVYKDYDSDYADVDSEHDFERDVYELKSQEMIDVRVKDKRISRIVLRVDFVNDVYKILEREPQEAVNKKQLEFYKDWLGHGLIIDKYCNHQIDLLLAGKKTKYELETAENLLRLLDFVYGNNEMILERELSIAVFGDTKVFENEYKSKLIYILKTYGEYGEIFTDSEDDKEAMQIIFEELNIYANPKYVYFKGNGEIVFENDICYQITIDIPLAFPMDRFSGIKAIHIHDSKVMTVENLASYSRINPEDCFCIYLAGYHNLAKRTMIKLIDEQNPDVKWFHFGDIDPDGFMILENLKTKTGINFTSIHMSVNELKIYGKYTKALNANDIKKAHT